MRTLDESWREFDQYVLEEAEFDEDTRILLRRVFYTGAASMFDLVKSLGNPDLSNAQRKARHDVWQGELLALLKEFRDDVAPPQADA